MTTGFYVERRVTNPNAIPAETELTGYGYCSPECAARHHILEEDIELQDIGNYEETDASVLMTSPDGGVRGEGGRSPARGADLSGGIQGRLV